MSCQQQQQYQQRQQINDDELRPIRKFSSFFSGAIQYQCVQTCYPNVPSQPTMLVELCNKICPFNPKHPECAKCPEVGDFTKKSMITQPEAIVVEPDTHAIMFTPEIVVAGEERKQCCYLDKCHTVPLDAKCAPICYEPCDAACTGRCMVNPQCPHECDRIAKQQYKMRYRIWLANKLNDIKQKYRELAKACLLRTRMAFVNEVQGYYKDAKQTLGDVSLDSLIGPTGQIQDEDGIQGQVQDEQLNDELQK